MKIQYISMASIASETGSENICDKSVHLILRINSLFNSPVSFSYESHMASSQDKYSVNFQNVAITQFKSKNKFELDNPIPKLGESCKVTIKPDSRHVSFSGNILGALSEAGRTPLTYTRLHLGLEVFQNIEHLIVEVRFPDDLRGYVKQSKVSIHSGEKEVLKISKHPFSYHHYSGEKITHFFSTQNVNPSRIVVSACFRLKPSLVLNLLTPFLFGALVLFTWLYAPLELSYQLSVTVALLSLYVSLWYRSQHYVIAAYDNLVNLSYISLPFSWLLIVLQSFLMSKQLDVYFIFLYAALIAFVGYTIIHFLLFPDIGKWFQKLANLMFLVFYAFLSLLSKDYKFPSRLEISQAWKERPSGTNYEGKAPLVKDSNQT